MIWALALAGCVVFATRRAVLVLWPNSLFAGFIVRFAVIGTALVVATMLILGAAAHLTLLNVVVADAALALVALALSRRSRAAAGEASAAPAIAVGCAAGIIALAIPFAVAHAPFTLYDSLSYHLFFAARWVQDRAISIIPTPFSDVAQAYAPGNGELVFAWMMAPLGSDAVARMGQLPFAIVAAAALVAIARRLDAPAAFAFYPAAFLLVSRPIVEQMVGSNVDLICAALFLTSAYLVVAAADSDAVRDWAIAGVSVGLYAGTKYLALVYLPVLIVLALGRGWRTRSLWMLPGAFAFAAPWYLRNWIVAGSPIYPASLMPFGIPIARGAFARTAMLNTIFHTTDVRLIPAIAAHAFGPTLFVVWLPVAVIGCAAMLRRGWWPHAAVAMAPFAMAVLFWIGLPVNVDSRFLLPAIGLALIPFAFVATGNRRTDLVIRGIFSVALVWVAVGSSGSLPGTVPWFMGGWLSLRGIVAVHAIVPFVAVATLLALAWRATRSMAVIASATAICAIALTMIGSRDYLETTPTYVRAGYADSWDWIRSNVTGATIAYTGINLPYPLTGSRLGNRVVYANIDGRARWRFHDYDHAYRAGRWSPREPLLATSSGELMPVAQRSGPRDDALRPRYERMQGIPEAWFFNLETMNVRYLFVAMLSAYEIDYVWHNERGFPIEDDWAGSDPSRFRLVYTNPQVHIYEVDLGKRASA